MITILVVTKKIHRFITTEKIVRNIILPLYCTYLLSGGQRVHAPQHMEVRGQLSNQFSPSTM